MGRKKTKRPMKRKYERRDVRNGTGEIQKVKNYTKTYKKKPKTVFASTREYDFLRHLKVVMRWAIKNHDITRSQLEVLLYFYPMGVFTKSEFYYFVRATTLYQVKFFKVLQDKGYIIQWRKRGNGHKSDLYTLSHKAKHLCDSMHKYMVGDKPIPEEATNNDLANPNTGVKMDKYYMDIIKKMNKESAKKRKEKEEE